MQWEKALVNVSWISLTLNNGCSPIGLQTMKSDIHYGRWHRCFSSFCKKNKEKRLFFSVFTGWHQLDLWPEKPGNDFIQLLGYPFGLFWFTRIKKFCNKVAKHCSCHEFGPLPNVGISSRFTFMFVCCPCLFLGKCPFTVWVFIVKHFGSLVLFSLSLEVAFSINKYLTII